MINQWAAQVNAVFTGLIIPNVFGPFCKPNYNSVIATFCHQLTNGSVPKIEIDAPINLLHVGDLVKKIIEIIDLRVESPAYVIDHEITIKVSALLSLLQEFKQDYHIQGIIPIFKSKFELQLFNTFRSYESIDKKYPVRYIKHSDLRGDFTELIKLNGGGQVSFSTTHPGITRGNHFHTRKIERFSVIKGKARIQLRQIGTAEIFNFDLNGDEPSYVDMPVWYTHNITNIGDTDLYTVFWINEFYDTNDPDTFMEVV
jgi:UDP-2-acetamido-2,6-beta-L-arabino-hexul-4-ose reductase